MIDATSYSFIHHSTSFICCTSWSEGLIIHSLIHHHSLFFLVRFYSMLDISISIGLRAELGTCGVDTFQLSWIHYNQPMNIQFLVSFAISSRRKAVVEINPMVPLGSSAFPLGSSWLGGRAHHIISRKSILRWLSHRHPPRLGLSIYLTPYSPENEMHD